MDINIKVHVPGCHYDEPRAVIRAAFPERARPHIGENPLIVDVVNRGATIDFLLAIPGYEENIISRSVLCPLGNMSVWICSAEDLITQKAVDGRPRDWQRLPCQEDFVCRQKSYREMRKSRLTSRVKTSR